MRKILLSTIISFNVIIAYAQVQQKWVKEYNYSSGSDDYGNVMTKDAEGFIYVAGQDGTNDSDEDVMTVIKYDKSGTVIWKRVYGTGTINWDLRPSAIVVDGDYVYITASGVYIGNVFTTLKYEKDGDLVWIRRFGGVGDFHHGTATDVVADGSGNVFVTGFLYTTEDNEDPDFFNYSDFVTVKYDPEGNLEWVRQFNGASPGNGLSTALSIITDNSGFIYVTGMCQIDGQMDISTIKYNTNGTIVWIQRYNGAGNGYDAPSEIVSDASNNIYITGYSYSGSEGGRAFTTLKYNSDGEQLWVRTINGGTGYALVLDANANVYVTGGKSDGSQSDYFTIKYTTNGELIWSNTFNGPLSAMSHDFATDIALDQNSNVYVTGECGTSIGTVRYNSNGTQAWSQVSGSLPSGVGILYQYVYNSSKVNFSIATDAFNNVFVFGSHDPGISGDKSNFITIAYSQCEIICPSNITVNNDPDKCNAIVTFSPATYTGDCGSSFTYSHDTGIEFPIGVTTVTVTSDETGATCSFTITVNDNQLPVLTCPANQSVNMNVGLCYATVVPGLATATDNCSATVAGVRSDNLALNANYPGGVTTITWTATDPSNNTSTCLQTITVVDNELPVIAGGSASVVVLSPSNHTMRDVAISYTATDNCAVTSVVNVTSNEPINGVGDGDTDPDWIVTDNHHVVLRAERSANGTGRIYTITVTATDGSGNTATKTVEVRVPHNIKNPHSGQPFKVGSTVTFEGEFWDKAGNSHSAKWMIDENTTVKATVTEPLGNKNGKVTGSYKFTAPGVYKLQMNVTDQKGITHYSNTAGDLEAIVVIYDPNGGYAYGGGYYNSPAGAFRSNPSATGKASYGFTLNYFKNSTYPKGETQFDFKVGSFEFNALNFEYLVINNSMSQFKGTGKIIGGQSGVGFTMTVVDGQLDGSGVDKIRMKIYNRSNGSIIYDNQPGASDAALPSQAVGANSIIVISGTNSSLTQSNTTQKAEMEATAPEVSGGLDVVVYPNPSATNFSISVKANSVKGKITMQVVDMYGRVMETRNVNANSPVRFGDRYNPGTYFVRVLQGKEHKEIKLIKLSD